MSENDRVRADAVYRALLDRAGEQWVQPRVERTQRVLDLLDNPQRNYRVIHITGTNGKSSTSRIVESILRAYGLRTGLFTSPHLERFTERIMVDGEPIDDAAVADAWEEILPFVTMVDQELVSAGDAALTYFELLTVLAFVAFSDAPVDVGVIEVGMGGRWDSTNTADGDVAVFAPIDIDHVDRLGGSLSEIADVKSGILKSGALAVSAPQQDVVRTILQREALARSATIRFMPDDFGVDADRLAVGGQQVSVRGIAGSYEDLYVPLYGRHQATNTAVAIAAVESLIGAGEQALSPEVLTQGLADVVVPGRLTLAGAAPTVIVDAAHNPHGARALAAALGEAFDFDEWGVVLGVLSDKDAAGIVDALAPASSHIFATAPDSERAADGDTIADIAESRGLSVTVHRDLDDAAESAREWAAANDRRAVVIAGSVVLAGEALLLAREQDWKSGWRG